MATWLKHFITTVIFGSTLVFSTLNSRCALADVESSPVTVDLSAAFLSDYMFRGFNLYDGASIQPAANVNYDTGIGKLTGGVWMHLSAEGDRQEEKFTELDGTIKYSNTFDCITASVGNVWYTYPDSGDQIVDTAEVFATVAVDTLLTPTVSVFHDWDEFDAQYYELAFSHPIKTAALGEGFNVTPFAAFGFGSNAEKVYANNGLEQITVGTTFNLSLGDIAVIPALNYTFKVDDATTNEFWVGSTFAYSF